MTFHSLLVFNSATVNKYGSCMATCFKAISGTFLCLLNHLNVTYVNVRNTVIINGHCSNTSKLYLA